MKVLTLIKNGFASLKGYWFKSLIVGFIFIILDCFYGLI